MAVQSFHVGVKALIRNHSGKILMVHIPSMSANPPHWDLPGGRIDTGETFLETLKRELLEEIGLSFVGIPKQLMSFPTKITISVGGVRLPLIFVVYDVELPKDSVIKLDPHSAEDDYKWFEPAIAADEMTIKFSADFCDLVRGLYHKTS